MSRLYVLASVPKQGKTTTALLLEKYFRSKGLKVACLHPTTKKQWDAGLYLKNNCPPIASVRLMFGEVWAKCRL